MNLVTAALSINPSNRICKKLWVLCQFMSLSSSSSAGLQPLDVPEEKNTHFIDYVELRKEMQNFAKFGCISKAVEVLRVMRHVPGKPTVYDYNSLINCYLKSKNVVVDDLFGLYLEIKRAGLYPNAITFNTLLKGMNLLGDWNQALSVVGEMCKYGFIPSFSCLSNLFKNFLDNMDLADACSVLELMLKFNYIPTVPKVVLLVDSLSRCGMIHEAYLVFSHLLEKGFFPGAYVYNPILWALCKSNGVYAALAIFCSVKKKGLVHNVCSYTALIYGFSKEGFFEEAYHCMVVMEIDGGGCPNVKTYTTVIKFLCYHGRIREALGLLERMEKNGCYPDIITYNIIICELCRQNMILERDELLETIHQKGFSPDAYTYAALVGEPLKRGDRGIAHNLLLDIVARDSVVDVAICNIYLHTLCCSHKSQEALSFIKGMIREGLRPNNVSYNTILKGICEENNVDEALEFLDHIEWPDKSPDVVSFNTLLSAACKKGDFAMVRRVFYRMDYEGIKLNVVGFTCLIQYFCSIGKIRDCLELLELMIADGPRPSIVTINTLMVNLCKNRELEIAHQVFTDLKRYGLSPDLRTFNILVCAAINEGNDFLVAELRREMYSRGLKPHDPVTCQSFIYGFCKEGKISAALQLRDQMRENGITLNIGIYNTILEAMYKRGKSGDIVSLLKEMAKDRCEPDAYSLEILRRALSKTWMQDDPGAARILELVLRANPMR